MTLPPLPPSFYWDKTSCGVVLKCRPLDAIAPHVFTTRGVALSSASDWGRVADALEAREVAILDQVHGRAVVAVRRSSPAGHGARGDALVSDDPDVAVAVRAADCVPLLYADARTGTVAAVHAGWRGTAAGVAAATVDVLVTEFGVRPEHLTVAIGPSIHPRCYEVGSELVEAFIAAGHARPLVERWFISSPPRPSLRLDLQQANRDQLTAAGVADAHIHDCGLCTAMHLDVLTSYRAENGQAGRIGGVIRTRGNSAQPPDPSPRLPGGRRPG